MGRTDARKLIGLPSDSLQMRLVQMSTCFTSKTPPKLLGFNGLYEDKKIAVFITNSSNIFTGLFTDEKLLYLLQGLKHPLPLTLYS